ncbi:hypothetical protein ATANTOWER_003195 [Ataeniobius toweri]|uniref:Uncharacterized protein n=1 Tax=Ataeniobius toweri TaxID=208326 RepID=A0ABU7AP40_9TELE|nr:hypothetical protein [Ataeniobius toweri]
MCKLSTLGHDKETPELSFSVLCVPGYLLITKGLITAKTTKERPHEGPDREEERHQLRQNKYRKLRPVALENESFGLKTQSLQDTNAVRQAGAER